ncbi:MAG: acyl-homoserine-lactone synthase [Arenibacterium sp.]
MKHSRNTLAVSSAASVFPELAPADDIVSDPPANPSARAPDSLRIQPIHGITTTVMSFATISEHGDLLVNYLRARKEIFIDRLKWDLPHTDGMEFDQYDTPMCRWVIIHEGSRVLAGVRLMPTTARCGIYSYMLRDGQMGLLNDFPTDVLFFEAPVEEDVWEASRLFVVGGIEAQKRARVQMILMKNLMRVAADLNAARVIGIVPAAWSRWLRRLGLYATPVGPKFDSGSMTSQAALFNVADQIEWAMSETR